jgi:hypothetical protein
VRFVSLIVTALAISFFAQLGAAASAGTAANAEEFFILSSIDSGRARLVLKRPTEVTVIMRVTDQTAYRTGQGKRLELSDLRAGDTAYITFTEKTAGDPVALAVRLGPMTVDELHRRYLKTTR